MSIITIKEAIAQSSTPSELRVLANCLDRIADRGYEFTQVSEDGEPYVEVIVEQDTSPGECRRNAAALRRLAGQLQRLNAHVK